MDTPRQSPARAAHRLLVVDDDISLRQLSAELLSHSGYEVDAAEDGAAAWEALGAESYDLMITDNKMPNLSGVELLKKLYAAHMDSARDHGHRDHARGGIRPIPLAPACRQTAQALFRRGIVGHGQKGPARNG